MINIALFSHSNYLTGAGRMLFNLAKGLKDNEAYNPIVFIPKSGQETDEMSSYCKANDIEYKFIIEYPYYIFNNSGDLFHINSLTENSILNLDSILRYNGIDVVIVNTLVAVPAILAAKKLGLPVITWVHGILDPVSARGIVSNSSFERQLYIDRILLSISDEVVYCSNWTKRYYSSYIDKEGVTINNWTSENSEGDIPLGSCKFVCLNTFDKYKGIDTLIKAASIVKKHGYQFELDIYGDGSESTKKSLKSIINTNNLENNIRFKGRVVDTSKVYRESTCLIQPSYLESFGLTIIEAMAHSRPVIVAKSGGPEDIVIDGETGYLVEKNDEKAIAEKMIDIIENPDKNKKFGINAYKNYVKKYNGELSIAEFVNIIERLFKSGNSTNKTQKLLYHSIIRVLDLEKKFCIQNATDKSELDDISKNYILNRIEIPKDIIFSKSIENERLYKLKCDCKELSKLGFIFASLSPISGKGILEIYFKGKKLRKIEFELEHILQNRWTVFEIEPLYFNNEREFEVKFSFDYRAESGRIGIFHNNNRNTLYNRILSKLNVYAHDSKILCVYMK